MSNRLRWQMACLLALLCFGSTSSISADEQTAQHPLAIHMNQWLTGSREWTTPNPDHDAANPASFAEFRVRWDWGPLGQQLLGKLFGVREDGSTMLFWNMYTTYNPAKRTVIFQQIGRGGAYIHGEHPFRAERLAFGEIERLDTTMYTNGGISKVTRHENTFNADGSHHANVFERTEDGEWTPSSQWDWRLVPESDVMGKN